MNEEQMLDEAEPTSRRTVGPILDEIELTVAGLNDEFNPASGSNVDRLEAVKAALSDLLHNPKKAPDDLNLYSRSVAQPTIELDPFQVSHAIELLADAFVEATDVKRAFLAGKVSAMNMFRST